MARSAPVESLVDRRYRHDLREWAEWRQQQARLRRLAGRALDALEKQLDAGGGDAVKAAALILRMAASSQAPTLPNRYVLEMDDAQTLAAGITNPPGEGAASVRQ